MKVIQINTVFNTGSTGKITAALYQLSLDNDIEPLVAYGRGSTPTEHSVNGYLIGSKIDFFNHVLYNFFTGKNGFASKKKTIKFLEWLDIQKPDIIHLHNIHGFYIHVGLLFDYIKAHNIPVIWTLHDCWPFTGHCAFFDYINCEKWKTHCKSCEIYRTNYPYSIFKDNSYENYELKKTSFTGVPNMTIVTPSQWLAKKVKLSFLSEYPIKVINNGIDLNIFKPTNSDIIPLAKTLHNYKILLGVANVWDKRKGLDYFIELSKEFNSKNGYHIVLIGLSKKQCYEINKFSNNQITCLARTNKQSELAAWYSVAHLYINPTLEDNFPTTNLEALACGTPVITFNTGGSPESLTEATGKVVRQGSVAELISAIKNYANNSVNTSACILQAQNNNKAVALANYISLYHQHQI